MRLDWIRDRVKKGQLIVNFLPGVLNLADSFTKSLPVQTHVSISPLYVTYPPKTVTFT